MILTDQVAYEVNVQNMMKVDEVKDQFLDGAPADFKIAAMREKGSPVVPALGEGSASFIVTEDGRLFTLNEICQLFGRKISYRTLLY